MSVWLSICLSAMAFISWVFGNMCSFKRKTYETTTWKFHKFVVKTTALLMKQLFFSKTSLNPHLIKCCIRNYDTTTWNFAHTYSEWNVIIKWSKFLKTHLDQYMQQLFSYWISSVCAVTTSVALLWQLLAPLFSWKTAQPY